MLLLDCDNLPTTKMTLCIAPLFIYLYHLNSNTSYIFLRYRKNIIKNLFRDVFAMNLHQKQDHMSFHIKSEIKKNSHYALFLRNKFRRRMKRINHFLREES